MIRRIEHGVARSRDRESGQALVEFAIILFPLLMIVSGIIWFGIGLNYWLDMQRIANQGARWAAVNNWPPDCPRGSVPPACTGTSSLSATLKRQAITNGLEDNVRVIICFPSETLGGPNVRDAGDPVRVRLENDYKFFWVLDSLEIELVGEATMRLEQDPDLFAADPMIVKPCPA